jgi:micrococcal nuclease
MKKFITQIQYDSVILWFTILLLLIIASCMPALAQTIDSQDTSSVVVIRVVDGDTFVCTNGSDTAKVRILGFDAFETRNGDRLDKQAARAGISVERALALGNKAKDEATALLLDKTVILHRGNKRAPNRDLYGRSLRYVIVNDEDFAAAMIRRCYAAPNKR